MGCRKGVVGRPRRTSRKRCCSGLEVPQRPFASCLAPGGKGRRYSSRSGNGFRHVDGGAWPRVEERNGGVEDGDHQTSDVAVFHRIGIDSQEGREGVAQDHGV